VRNAGEQRHSKYGWPRITRNARIEEHPGGWYAAMCTAALSAATCMADGMRAKIHVRHGCGNVAAHRHGLWGVRATLGVLARASAAHGEKRKQTDNDEATQEIHTASHGMLS
jgi:hypothetical protein